MPCDLAMPSEPPAGKGWTAELRARSQLHDAEEALHKGVARQSAPALWPTTT